MSVCGCGHCADASYVDRCEGCGIALDRHGRECGFETGDVAPRAEGERGATLVVIPECDVYALVASPQAAALLVELETGVVTS